QAAPAHADPGAVTGVGRLGPAVTGVEGEGDPGGPDPGGERAGGVVAGVARLEVDVVVGARGQDVGVGLVDRHRRLVLLVGGKRAGGPPYRHQRLTPMGARGVAGAPRPPTRATNPPPLVSLPNRMAPSFGAGGAPPPSPPHPKKTPH